MFHKSSVVSPLHVLAVAALLPTLPFELSEKLAMLLSLPRFHFPGFLCNSSLLALNVPLRAPILSTLPISYAENGIPT